MSTPPQPPPAAAAPRKQLTLLFVLSADAQRVLLGLKKRGFGAGKWNGFGGKVEAGETLLEAAQRELEEESGVRAVDPQPVATIIFEFEGDATLLEVHVFRATAFTGEPHETEEMRPQWFDFADIPFDDMWLDDRIWFPLMREGRAFDAYFLFRGHDAIVRHSLTPRVS